ncbi:hypothetical protein LAZ67_5001992 [Cordylochernes scorpioides]|uniref:Transposase n=1 Tax=Cordylochernes scorpioides TaxID=51811 RepID=A0ABY6KGS3_9ARAC|nr:hypothetical protein LAZ67_5001992 [Cordylochernes scorpioides]
MAINGTLYPGTGPAMHNAGHHQGTPIMVLQQEPSKHPELRHWLPKIRLAWLLPQRQAYRSLNDDDLAILASAKTCIYKYFHGTEECSRRSCLEEDSQENRDVIKYQQKKNKSAKDAIIPELSIKLINAFVEAKDGEYIIEENHKMFQTNGLRLARSLINVVNKETYIWITNQNIKKPNIVLWKPASRRAIETSFGKVRGFVFVGIRKIQLSETSDRYRRRRKPIKHKPYRVSAKEREIIKEQIDEMLRDA